MKRLNRKAAGPIAIVWAVFLGIVLLAFLGSGGLISIIQISRFLNSIPAPVWAFVGIIILFKILFGGRK
jgi:uncharacterized protein with PQ loop repeat